MNNFKCKRCGLCCGNPEEHEYACILTKKDLVNPEIKKVAILEFLNGYVIPYIDGKCPFLENNKCSIHLTKPYYCKLYHCK